MGADNAKNKFETVEFNIFGSGWGATITTKDVEAMEISIPSLSEQGQIGAFLLI